MSSICTGKTLTDHFCSFTHEYPVFTLTCCKYAMGAQEPLELIAVLNKGSNLETGSVDLRGPDAVGS